MNAEKNAIISERKICIYISSIHHATFIMYEYHLFNILCFIQNKRCDMIARRQLSPRDQNDKEINNYRPYCIQQ